jgi:hypothetical protein
MFKVNKKVIFPCARGRQQSIFEKPKNYLFGLDMDHKTSCSCFGVNKVQVCKISYLQGLWNIEKKNYLHKRVC